MPMAGKLFRFRVSRVSSERVHSPVFGGREVGKVLKELAVTLASPFLLPPALMLSENFCRICCTAHRINSRNAAESTHRACPLPQDARAINISLPGPPELRRRRVPRLDG